VEYAGWNAYGASWHVLDFGVYRMWPKPLAIDAVIEPCCPVLRSVMLMYSPARVSCRWNRTVSPGFISRSFLRSGLTAAKLGLVTVPLASGLAGACDLPLRVM